MNFAVLASTNGSDLPAIFEKFEDGSIQGQIMCGVVNNENCGAQEKLESKNIPTSFVSHKGKDREAFDKEVSQILENANTDYIICVGYMRILSPWFVQKWERKILNVHPALLPAFPGAHAIQDALEAGVNKTGCTVHFIDEGVDTGPILAQYEVDILESDTLDSVKAKIQKGEQIIYPQVIEKISKKIIF